MAALKLQQDQSGKLTLQSSMFSGIGNIASMLVWLGIMAVFFLPGFQSGQVDWANMGLLLFFAVVTIGSTVLSSLLRTVVTIDPSARTLTSSRRLLSFPVQTNMLRFNEIENVTYEFYRQQSGRYSHDAWRVAAMDKNGTRMLINWDGKKEEMADLAQKVSGATGAPIVDNSEKPASTAQQILDRMRGRQPETQDGQQLPADVQPQPNTLQGEQPWQPPAMPPMISETAEALADAGPAATDISAQSSVWSMSVDELEKRVAADSIDSDARFALARRYQSRGQFDRAIDAYQKVIQLDPANASAQNDLGIALQQRGRRAEAEVAYRRAIALDPFSSTAHLNLGLLLRSLNRASEASQEFFQARQNARGDAETRRAEAGSTGGKLDPQLAAIPDQ